MSSTPENQPGLAIEKIEFDADGEITGLDDTALDAISGGLLVEQTNSFAVQTQCDEKC